MAKSLIGGVQYKCGGTFSTGSGDNSSVTFELLRPSGAKLGAQGDEAGTMAGFVAQQISASVSKQDRQVFEIGSNRYFKIMGRPSGQGSIQHLVGPNTVTCWKTMDAWAGCEPTTLKIEVKKLDADCGKSGKGDGPIYFNGGFLNSVQVGLTAGDVVVTSSLGFTFMDLSDSYS